MPFIGFHQAGNHVETGRLSRSVRPKQSDDFTLVHLKGNALHNGTLAVLLDDMFGAEFQQEFICSEISC